MRKKVSSPAVIGVYRYTLRKTDVLLSTNTHPVFALHILERYILVLILVFIVLRHSCIPRLSHM